jgi:hypothetical protein
MRISKSIERWFPVPDDPDKSEHLIRHLKPGEILDSINETVTQETHYLVENDQIIPDTVSKSVPGEAAKRQCIAAIVDWKNMFDENGVPLKCTEENKIRALREIDGYFSFVIDCRNLLAEDIKKEKEARAKNL